MGEEVGASNGESEAESEREGERARESEAAKVDEVSTSRSDNGRTSELAGVAAMEGGSEAGRLRMTMRMMTAKQARRTTVLMIASGMD